LNRVFQTLLPVPALTTALIPAARNAACAQNHYQKKAISLGGLGHCNPWLPLPHGPGAGSWRPPKTALPDFDSDFNRIEGIKQP
jgi:hypothetical protein